MPEIIIGNKNISERITKIILNYLAKHNGHEIKLRHLDAKDAVYKRYTCADCTKGEDLIFLFKKNKIVC